MSVLEVVGTLVVIVLGVLGALALMGDEE